MTEFITRNYGSKEFEVIIKTDNKEHYEATQDFARRLIDHAKPMTNADRIRAMSDDELARCMLQFVIDCFVASGIENPKWNDGSEEKMIAWLKQPADLSYDK